MRSRPKIWSLVVVLIVAVITIPYWLGFRINITKSMPVGIYFLRQARNLHRGQLVAIQLPRHLAALGLNRGYVKLADVLLFKRLIAVPKDTIEFKNGEAIVNARFIYKAPQFKADPHGRNMNPIHDSVIYTCEKNDYWVLGVGEYSWDSRYFGPLKRDCIVNTVRSVLML